MNKYRIFLGNRYDDILTPREKCRLFSECNKMAIGRLDFRGTKLPLRLYFCEDQNHYLDKDNENMKQVIVLLDKINDEYDGPDHYNMNVEDEGE